MATEQESRQWSLMLHLSQLLGLLLPVAGYLAPILIWQIKKAEMPALDEHGKEVTNWIITSLIAIAVAVILLFTCVGAVVAIPLLLVVGILGIVYPIIGALKANDGVVWKYPGALPIFK